MGRRQGNAVNFDGNEALNVRAQNLPSAPSSPKVGQFYFDTTLDRLCFRTGAATWVDPTNRTSHQGTQPSSTISDLATVVKGYRLDEFAAPTTSVSFGGQRAINGATPTSASDLTTKNYVDLLVQGLSWKESVRVATTGNIALTGLQTIDGITLVDGDRVLVKANTTGSENGIWLARTGAWERAPDATIGQLKSGASVMIREGTANQDQQWRLITDGTIQVGTTALVWTQIGAVISYTGTGGIIVTGNVISPDTTILVRKAAGTLGDGSSTNLNFGHALGTLDVTCAVFQISDGAEIDVDVIHSSTNQVTLVFASAPASNSLRVVVHG